MNNLPTNKNSVAKVLLIWIYIRVRLRTASSCCRWTLW